MAQYRSIHSTFWTDSKVVDDFTPEDKLFYLYLMTNPHTSICGCYEISIKQMADETGYSKETVEKLIDRMMNTHGVISYSKDTKEVLILNWHKYNWTSSENVIKAINTSIKYIKFPVFKQYLQAIQDGIDTVSIRYIDGMPTSVIGIGNRLDISERDRGVGEEETKDSYSESVIDIMDYFNSICGTKFRASTASTKKHIVARLKEGFTVDDFKRVIDNKAADWKDDPKMQKYLRPETLFSPSKFEAYLNEKSAKSSKDEDLDALMSGWV